MKEKVALKGLCTLDARRCVLNQAPFNVCFSVAFSVSYKCIIIPIVSFIWNHLSLHFLVVLLHGSSIFDQFRLSLNFVFHLINPAGLKSLKHPLHSALVQHKSRSYSRSKYILPTMSTDRYRKSFIPASIKMLNSYK